VLGRKRILVKGRVEIFSKPLNHRAREDVIIKGTRESFDGRGEDVIRRKRQTGRAKQQVVGIAG